MSKLIVHLECGTGGQHLAVEVIDARGSTTAEAVADGRQRTFPVTPGDYLVQAIIPSGLVIGKEVAVRTGQTVNVRLSSQAAPTADRSRPVGEGHRSGTSFAPSGGGGGGGGFAPSDGGSGRDWSYFAEPTGNDTGSTTALPPIWACLWAFDRSTRRWSPRPWTAGVTVGRNEVSLSVRQAPKTLCALQVGKSVPTTVAMLPPSSEPVEATVRLDDELGVAIEAHTANMRAESLLAYLTSGQLTSAGLLADEVVEDAESLLLDQRRDPVGCVVGALYLIRTRQLDRLHDWSRNLADRFPWLPDASLVRAAHLLSGNPPERDEAERRLLTAAAAGVPVYTQNLMCLYESLLLLAADEPTPFAEVLPPVRAYADACECTLPLTTFWGSPASPTLRRALKKTGPPGYATNLVE